MILAGIVLYNPNIKRLKENLFAIKNQVNKVIFIDNASANIDEIEGNVNFKDILIIKNSKNQGIAYALNQIMTYAKENQYEWVLTLDQDSVVAENLISEYSKYTNDKQIGIINPKIIDRNFTKSESDIDQNKISYPTLVITSGCLTRRSAWEIVGGFDEWLFIDSVDFDFCYRLTKYNYKILSTPFTNILHEVGHSRLVKFLGKEEMVYNHSAFRYYYIFRNKIVIGYRYNRLKRNILWLIKKLLLIIIYENNRYSKIKAIINGTLDGFKRINYERK